jgi:hypothetical protein
MNRLLRTILKNNFLIKTTAILVVFSFVLHLIVLHPCNNLLVLCESAGTINIESVDFEGNCNHAETELYETGSTVSKNSCKDTKLFNDIHDYSVGKTRNDTSGFLPITPNLALISFNYSDLCLNTKSTNISLFINNVLLSTERMLI